MSRALTAYNGIVLEESQVVLTEAISNLIQKELSEAIHKAWIKNIEDSSDLLQKDHFNLESAPRAGAWLNAIPSESSGNNVKGILFCYIHKRRLKESIFGKLFHWSLCDDVLDVYSDHALVCITDSNRISRHN